MNFDSGTAYPDSDADDEYDGAIADSSPVLDDPSPYDSELPSSNEHTPTTYGHRTAADRLPETIISEWTAEECADFIGTIGLQQYTEIFLENEIVGEALIALLHDDLKSMGMNSVGHRLTILKSVYDVKKAQDVEIESDHYIPLSADAEAQYANATLKDIKQLVEQLRLRDERMNLFEQDFRRLADDFRRLREDMLPALRLAKDAQQPLPNNPNNNINNSNINNNNSSGGGNQVYGYESTIISPPAQTPLSGQSTGSLRRQFSTKKLALGSLPPMSSSPTYMQSTHEPSIAERSLDPTSAAERAVMSSSHLAAMNGGSGQSTSPIFPPPNMPSPTSPPPTAGLGGATLLGSRSYRAEAPTPSSRSTFAGDGGEYAGKQTSQQGGGGGGMRDRDREREREGSRRKETPAPDTPSSNAAVEIFKSFRVSMDDPCYKVLPAALKKYQINAPWDQYALYIVYGDQERCLGLDEKPLILFKQLDREGKKPMFMLRKTNNAQVDLTADMPGSAGLGGSARGAATGYDPPGGII